VYGNKRLILSSTIHIGDRLTIGGFGVEIRENYYHIMVIVTSLRVAPSQVFAVVPK